MDLVHGGCIESCLHEVMLEALKLGCDAEAVIVELKCEIKAPHRQGVTYRLEAAARLPDRNDDDEDDLEGIESAFSGAGLNEDPDAVHDSSGVLKQHTELNEGLEGIEHPTKSKNAPWRHFVL